MILNASNQVLKIVLAGAVATSQCPITAAYIDGTITTYTPTPVFTVTNSTTAVSVVTGPASNQIRIQELTLYNADTVAVTATVYIDNNGTSRTICKITLAVGDSLQYVTGVGFFVIDSAGNRKGTTNVAGTTLTTGKFWYGVGGLATETTFGGQFGQAIIDKVVALVDGANIATDASLGNIFSVTLAGNRTLDNPTNPVAGQKIVYRIRQDATGSRTLAYGTAFRFSTVNVSPTLTTTAAKTDYLGFIYNEVDSKWDFVAGASKGF